MLHCWFLLHVQVKVYQNILKLRCWPLTFILNKAFLKKKLRSRTSSFLIFCMIYVEKYFSRYILLTDQIPLTGYLYFFRYWIICVLQLLAVQQLINYFVIVLEILLEPKFPNFSYFHPSFLLLALFFLLPLVFQWLS